MKDWNIQINYGIKTGFNEAFIINSQKREELLKKCPEAVDIIRPILRGRDIRKYKVEFASKWLINSHNGLKNKNINPIFLEADYPILFEHLKNFKQNLESRLDKGIHWSNLRNCAYLEEFEKDKIIWLELTDIPKFAYDEERYLVEATAFFMTGEHLKFLTVFLNSRLSEWYFDKITTTSGVGTNRWKKVYIEQLPIIKPTTEQEALFENYLDVIKKNKQTGLSVQELEEKINGEIFSLYELDNSEIELINSRFNKI